MKVPRVLKRLTLALVLTASVLVLAQTSSDPVAAQTSNENAAQGLQISPAIIELNGDANKSYTINLSVLNVTSTDLTFDAFINDFTSKNETGAPSILIDSVNPATSSIRKWVAPISSFTLKAREQKKLSITVNIPDQAEPGGHYGVIRFSGRGPTLNQTGVGLSVSAGSLVLVKVSGAVTEKLDLITYEATKNGAASPLFEHGPITFVQRFENKGTVHVKPVGQIEIRDMFGNKVQTLSVNQAGGNVLPLGIRRFESNLTSVWMFGRYTADLSIGYGTTGQAIVKTISFWVIPYKIIIGALLLLATVFFILKTLLKRYNSYIIKSASQSHDKKTKKHKK